MPVARNTVRFGVRVYFRHQIKGLEIHERSLKITSYRWATEIKCRHVNISNACVSINHHPEGK